MRSSSKRLISIVVVVFLFIGTLIVYGSFIKPAYEEIKADRTELAGQQMIKEQLKSASEQIQNLLAEYQDIGLVQETISAILPVKQQFVPQAIAQIVGLAENNGLPIQSLTSKQLAIKPSSSKLLMGLGTLKFDVRLIGDYLSLKTFIEQIESNIRLMDVVNLRIDPIGTPGQNIFLYTVTIDTYYQTQ